jgi:hypothetical protein
LTSVFYYCSSAGYTSRRFRWLNEFDALISLQATTIAS